MSDFLKKFKSVFIVDDGTTTPSSEEQQAQTQTQTAAPNQQAQQSVSSVAGSVNNKFVEILTAALEKNNQEGFDYFEFRQSLINLAKMPLDEATRYQSAYAMAQTMGVTPVKLIESAKFYLNVLSNEQAKFREAHTQQRAKLIGNREEELKNLDAMMQQKAEQIKQLTQQIEEHRKQSETMRSEINESTIKIENTKADFETTFNSVYAQIEQDMGKIQQYLK
ncbi:MAG: hypothetical protein WCR52_17480 [Bacteroidota bacterium]